MALKGIKKDYIKHTLVGNIKVELMKESLYIPFGPFVKPFQLHRFSSYANLRTMFQIVSVIISFTIRFLTIIIEISKINVCVQLNCLFLRILTNLVVNIVINVEIKLHIIYRYIHGYIYSTMLGLLVLLYITTMA